MPTSTPRSLRCRRRSCVWLGPRSTPANGGSPCTSLWRRHTGRQTANVWASWPRARYRRPRELLSTLFLRSFCSGASHFSSPFLCSSSPSGYTSHVHLTFSLKSVCFSQSFTAEQKKGSGMAFHTYTNPGSTGLSPFLLHFYWSFGLIISIYHFSLWISSKKKKKKKNHSER